MSEHEQEELDFWFCRQDRFVGFDRGDLDNEEVYGKRQRPDGFVAADGSDEIHF